MDNIELVTVPEKPKDVYKEKYTKTVQLTKRSRFRIVNKFLLWYKGRKNRKEATAIRKEINALKDKEEEYSKSKYMIEQGSLERVQRKIKVLEDRLDILDMQMKGINNEKSELPKRVKKSKPIRLTFRNLKEVRNSFYAAAALMNPLKKLKRKIANEDQMEVDLNKDVFSKSQETEAAPKITISNIPRVDVENSKETSSKISEDERLSNLLKKHMAPVEEKVQAGIEAKKVSIQNEEVDKKSVNQDDELERIPIFTPYEKQIYSDDQPINMSEGISDVKPYEEFDLSGPTNSVVNAAEEFDLSGPMNSVENFHTGDSNKKDTMLKEILDSEEFQGLQKLDSLSSVTNLDNDRKTVGAALPMHDTVRSNLEKDINAFLGENQQSTGIPLSIHDMKTSVMDDDSTKLLLEKVKQQLLELEGQKRAQQEKLDEARRIKEAAIQSESQATMDKEEALQFKEEAAKEKNQSFKSAEEAAKRREAVLSMFAERATKLQNEINDSMKMEAEENKLAEDANKRAEENRAVAEAAIKEGQENKAVSEANNRKAQQDMAVSMALEEMLGMSNVNFSKDDTSKHL